MNPKWTLIDAKGKLVSELDGRPAEIPEKCSLRCEETVTVNKAMGEIHSNSGTATGVANETARFWYLFLGGSAEYSLTVDGANHKDIEDVRVLLKSTLGIMIIQNR